MQKEANEEQEEKETKAAQGYMNRVGIDRDE